MVSEDLLIQIKVDASKGIVSVKDMTGALEDLRKAAGEGGKEVDHSSHSFIDAALAATGLNQAIELAQKAYEALAEPVLAAVEAYLEEEHAINLLNNAMKLNDQFTVESSKGMVEFAERIRDTSRVTMDAALQMEQLAEAAGLTNEQVKTLTQVSADVAAAIGKDVNGVMRELLGQLSGMPSRLAKSIPALKQFSDEQLRTGAGIQMLARRYKDFSEQDTKTLDGAIDQNKKSFRAFQVVVGDFLTDFVGLDSIVKRQSSFWKEAKAAVEGVREAFNSIKSQDIEKTAGAVSSFAIALTALASPAVIGAITAALPAIGAALGTIAAALIPATAAFTAFALTAGQAIAVAIAIDTIRANLDQMPKLIEAVGASFKEFFFRAIEGWSMVVRSVLLGVEKILEAFDSVAHSNLTTAGLEAVRGMISNVDNKVSELGDNAEKAFKQVDDALKDIKPGPLLETILKAIDAFKAGFSRAKAEAKEAGNAFVVAAKMTKEQIAALLKILDENQAIMQTIGSQFDSQETKIRKALALEVERLQVQRMQLDLSQEAGRLMDDAIGKQIELKKTQAEQQISSITPAQAAPGMIIEGASKMGGESFGKAASGIINGSLSEFAGSMSSVAGMIVEVVKMIVEIIPKFIESIGNLIKEVTNFVPNLMSAIGSVFEAIFDHITKQFVHLEEGMTNFSQRMDKMLSQNFEKLGEAQGKSLANIATKFPQMVEQWIKAIDKGVPALAQGFINALVEAFSSHETQVAMIVAFRNALYSSLLYSNIWITAGYKIWHAFIDANKGSKISPDIDADKMKESLKKLERIASDQLFKVVDMATTARGASRGREIEEQIRRGTDYFGVRWRAFWGWANDRWHAMTDYLGEHWHLLLDDLSGLWTGLMDGLSGVWEDLIRPILEGFVKGLSDAWNWICSNIIDPFIGALNKAWDWVKKNIVDNFPTFDELGGIVANLQSAVSSFITPPPWLATMTSTVTSFMKQPTWMTHFTNSISDLFETPGWLQDLIDAADKLARGGGGGGGFSLPFATGGMVPEFANARGYAAGGDTVPAWLTPGEFVMKRDAVSNIGANALRSMNAGTAQPQNGGGSTVTVGAIHITNTGNLDENAIRNRIIPTLKAELKKASYRGEGLISEKGLR